MYSKFAFCLFLLLTVQINYGQQKSNDFFEVIFFKFTEKDIKNRNFIKIDSLGNIYSFNKPTGDKLNIKIFNESIHKFVNLEPEVKKVPGSDNASDLTVFPKKGNYTFEITTTFLKDFHAENRKKTITNYYWVNVSDKNQKKLFFKYLSKKDKVILDKYLQ